MRQLGGGLPATPRLLNSIILRRRGGDPETFQKHALRCKSEASGDVSETFPDVSGIWALFKSVARAAKSQHWADVSVTFPDVSGVWHASKVCPALQKHSMGGDVRHVSARFRKPARSKSMRCSVEAQHGGGFL